MAQSPITCTARDDFRIAPQSYVKRKSACLFKFLESAAIPKRIESQLHARTSEDLQTLN